MDYVHHCLFCGWHREGGSPTVLSPRCESCGCALSSLPAADWREADGRDTPAPTIFTAQLVRLATILGALVLAFAAARTGYEEGGPAIAVAALGLAGLAATAAMSSTGRG